MEKKYFEKAEIFTWMPLIGFDKDQPDKGVGTLLKRMNFTPHAVSVFAFHSDVVNHHDGMDKVRVLPPDNCGYYANPYNEERRRQDWTNHDLKALADNLREAGIESYLGIMGVDLNDQFHKEWLGEHPEIRTHLRTAKWALNVLKRFNDGTYYEDFFADKVCAALTDYGFDGLHVTDNFCPNGGTRDQGDFSHDMLEQFVEYSGMKIPDEIMNLKEETQENINLRGDWIWANIRAEWLEFYGWRWEKFWKKICDRLHAIGKKVFVIGTYCTDPFATLYAKGVDLRRIVNAGVDYLMPNAAANASCMRHEGRPWLYYEHATMCALTDVFTDNGKKLHMLGVKDASEEWDMLHHSPNMLERDIYYMSSFHRQTDKGLKRSLDGFIVCLGDGIYEDEWKWLKDRYEVGFAETPVKYLTPALVWSDTGHYNLLPEYIKTRRYTPHKFMVELDWLGANTGSVVRTEHINDKSGDLFVPNFDLLSEDEKKMLAAYKGGSVIATASAEGDFKPENYGITPDIYFEDHDTPFKNMAFAYNIEIADKAAILDAVSEDDDTLILDDPFNAPEIGNTIWQQIPFQKVSIGFRKALAKLMHASTANLFEASHPVVPMQMPDGAIRMYVINDNRLVYASSTITIKNHDIDRVKVVSKFPLLPVKFSDEKRFSFWTQDYPGDQHTFRVLVPQGGVSIVDVYLKD